jgi:hypothetical protein
MNKKFNQWLAGLIDGDGYFALSKKGYAALEITLETRDSQCLYKIKKRIWRFNQSQGRSQSNKI